MIADLELFEREMQMSDNNDEEAIRELLLAMPEEGWMRGRGPHQETLHALLDSGSRLIAENVMPEQDGPPIEWLVRLTPAGIAQAQNWRNTKPS
jgi:hypothetical protein